MRTRLPIQRRPPLSRRLMPIMAAAAGGALLKHFLDPERGRARRATTMDQATAAVRRPVQKAANRATGLSQVARDKAEGLTHEATRTTAEELPENDQTLVDKVRSEVLGAERWRTCSINVSAADGVVTLHGELPHPEDINDLQTQIRAIPGVRDVEHHLHLPKTMAPNKEQARIASGRGGSGSYG